MEMKNRHVIGYGMGSFGKDLALGVIGSYLLVFYTDVVGISAAAAGMILFLAKIWDAVNDPMMGYLADRSRITKWGRYRPYILIIPVPLAVFSMLCFLAPDFSTGGKIAYAAVTYTITGMLFTAYDVPLWAMVPTLTKDQNTRNKLIASARVFTSLAMLIASAVALPAIQALGGGSEVGNLKAGYPRFMIIIGIASVIFAWAAFFSTKENHIDTSNKTRNVFKEFGSILNRPLILVLLTMVMLAVSMLIPAVSGVYYMIYYLHKPELIPVYMMISMGIGLIASILTPILMKRFTAKSMTVFAFALSAAANLLVFFIGAESIPAAFAMFACAGISVGIGITTITAMLAETADYIAEENGKRSDGVIFSMNSFAIKVGQAVAGILVSTTLALTGYVANQFIQPEAATLGILLTRSIIPAAVAVVGLVFALLYRLPEESS